MPCELGLVKKLRRIISEALARAELRKAEEVETEERLIKVMLGEVIAIAESQAQSGSMKFSVSIYTLNLNKNKEYARFWTEETMILIANKVGEILRDEKFCNIAVAPMYSKPGPVLDYIIFRFSLPPTEDPS